MAFATDSTGWGGAESCLEVLVAGVESETVTIFGVHDEVTGRLAKAATVPVEVVLLPARGSAVDPRPLLPWVRALRRHPVDALHVNAAFTFGNLYACAAAALTQTPYLIQEHLPLAPNYPQLQRPVKRALAARATAHIAVSNAAARETETHLGLPVGAVRTIANGIDPTAPVQGELPGGRPQIAAAGRLTGQKGFDLLLEALPGLPGAHLSIIGDGPDRAALERQSLALGVADRVSFLGWRGDSRGLLAAADIVAIPSRAEAAPLVLLEALAAARPVVMSRVGSAEEVLAGGRGWLIEPGSASSLQDALTAMLADPAEATRRGLAGQARVLAAYTRESMMAAWQAEYDAATAATTAAPGTGPVRRRR